jgi:hypothetical protein
MLVHFRKTGQRRYGVWVERDAAPPMMMHPAPGFDPYLPHDVLHFVADAEWGIDEAVFGQLAAGGDAGTFWPVERDVPNKWAHRGERLRKLGSGRGSERLAGLLEIAWHARRTGEPLPQDWALRLADAGVEDGDGFERVVTQLDALARRWHALQVGGTLTLEWPRPEGRPLRPTRSSASRAARRDAAATRARSAAPARG